LKNHFARKSIFFLNRIRERMAAKSAKNPSKTLKIMKIKFYNLYKAKMFDRWLCLLQKLLVNKSIYSFIKKSNHSKRKKKYKAK
jgi:hypothetical protein